MTWAPLGWSPLTGLWRHADFRKLWLAQSISAFGSRIGRTVLPVIAILSLDARPDQIGILAALSLAPGAVVGLLLGGRVDRSAKRRLLIGTHLARAALLVTVPAAGWLGLLTLSQLYIVAAGVGAATALFQIADNAYLRGLIGREQLVEGNAKLSTTDAVAEIGGPSLAGLLIELVTAPVALLFDVIAYLSAARILGAIRAPEAAQELVEIRPTLVSDLAIGLRAWLTDPRVRPMLLSFANNSFFNAFFATLYLIFTLETLGLSPGIVGLLIGAGGVGSIFGALGAQWAIARLGIGPAIVWLGGVSLAAGLLLPMAGGPLWLILLLLAANQVLADGFSVAHVVAADSLWQSVLPLGILGRARAVLQVTAGVLVPLGALTAGWLGTSWGVREAVWVGVLGACLSFVYLAASPLLRLRAIPPATAGDPALARAAAPPTR